MEDHRLSKKSKKSRPDRQSQPSGCANAAAATLESTHLLGRLHETIGNRGVSRLVQAKVKLSNPGDVYEQEADRVADQVMRMPDPTTGYEAGLSQQTVPQIQRLCTDCEEEDAMRKTPEEEEEEEAQGPVQAKPASGRASQVAPAGTVGTIAGGGQPLPASVRSFFEPRFQHDFSNVRIHTDAQAAASSQALNARAFTVGRDVVFGAGEYKPTEAAGRHLIAHELTHVLQQRGEDNAGTIHRWQLGTAPAPAGQVLVTDPEHIRRVDQAEDIVRGVLTSRNCRNYFRDNCTNGAGANALQQAFDNARIYHRPVDDNQFGISGLTSDIAYNIRAFRIGRFMLASTLLHEMFHTCDPVFDPGDELDAENAVETCRLHTPWIDTVTPRSGAVGSRVTILGWGFGPTPGPSDEVLIGGVAATVVTWEFLTDNSSRVRIVVEVPAGAGNGIVVVNNTVRSNAANFTVI